MHGCVEKKMNRIFHSISVLFLVSTLFGAEPTKPLDALGPLKKGKSAPWFALRRIPNDSGVVNLNSVRKKLGGDGERRAVFVFFADWCAPCMAGLHAVAARRSEFVSRGIPLVFVDVSLSGAPEKSSALLGRLGLGEFWLVEDRFGQQARDWGIAAGSGTEGMQIPATVVVDGRGVVRSIYRNEGSDYVDLLLAIK